MSNRNLRYPGSGALSFDLRELQIFLAACETGGMGAAAKMLGLTQPAVSQAIRELEVRLKTKLLDRSVRPLALTPAGSILKQRALSLVGSAHQIEPAIREAEKSQIPLVRIGVADSLSRALILTVTGLLRQRVRELSIVSGFTGPHAEGIVNRSLDMLIGVNALQDFSWTDRYTLFDDPFILITPANTRPAVVDLAELEQMPLIRYSQHSMTGRDIERYLRRLRIEMPLVEEYDNPRNISAAVAAGHGWAITTALCAFEGGLGLPVNFIELPPPKFSRRLYLICRKGELGGLPKELVSAIRSTIIGTTRGDIVSKMPWLNNELLPVGDHRAAMLRQ